MRKLSQSPQRRDASEVQLVITIPRVSTEQSVDTIRLLEREREQEAKALEKNSR